jgi:hypothetical protein
MDDERLGEQRFDEPASLEQCRIVPRVEDIMLSGIPKAARNVSAAKGTRSAF